jgi:hypothetical protein
MSQTAPAAVVPEDPVSIVRLHGEACYFCGAVSLPLYPAGSVTTRLEDGGERQWFVVACARHRWAVHG